MRTLTVTGHGSVQVVPDTATVRLAAVHRAPELAASLDGATSAIATIVALAKRFTPADRIASRNLEVWPAHDHEGRPAGFESRHSVSVGCTDLAQAGALVSAVAAEGGDPGAHPPAEMSVASARAEVAFEPGRTPFAQSLTVTWQLL